MAEERLQKVLARAGIASRRASETLISEGRVSVDGRVVRELGVRVDSRSSRIEVDGKRLVAEPLIYIILHKPRGVMCTLSDPEGRPTVADLLRDVGVRVVPIGRLDFHTSGALLCTNDGEFAGKLLHPRGKVPKEYVAKVRGVVDEKALERWRESIVIDGRATQPADVHLLRIEGDKSWLSIVLKEGRNRQVRRLGEATGFEVLRLARVSHAGITADKLRPGQWRHLTREELKALKLAYGVPRRVHTPPELDHMGGRVVRSSTARTRSPSGTAARRSANERGTSRRAGGPDAFAGDSRKREGTLRSTSFKEKPFRDAASAERGPRHERTTSEPRARQDRGTRDAGAARADRGGPGARDTKTRGDRRPRQGVGRTDRAASDPATRGERAREGLGRNERSTRDAQRSERGGRDAQRTERGGRDVQRTERSYNQGGQRGGAQRAESRAEPARGRAPAPGDRSARNRSPNKAGPGRSRTR